MNIKSAWSDKLNNKIVFLISLGPNKFYSKDTIIQDD